MFDLAWSEIALIGVVALVVIGPKDLPEAIRGVARGIAKLRKMASEFQSQAEDLVREANLDEVRNTISDIRNFNIRGELEKAIDADGSVRKAFTEDPLKEGPAAATPEPPKPVVEAPAFVPPAYAATPPASVLPPPPPVPAPAFVPPAEAGFSPPPVTNADFADPLPPAAAVPEPAPAHAAKS